MTEKDLKKRKEMIIKFMKEPGYVPMRKRDMAGIFRVQPEAKEEFSYVLECLVQEGTVSLDTKGRYFLDDALVLLGEYRGTAREFGFVTPEDNSEDIFIEGNLTLGALNGDTVSVLVYEDGGKRTGKSRSGKIIKIV